MSYFEGSNINSMLGGHQQYIFQVFDFQGRVSYRYIKNPRASKFYSLEFEVIPDITKKYEQVVILKDRVHFFTYNKLDHAMYIIGSKKGIVSLPTSKPIIGVLYDYVDQPLENDRFLLVDDVS